MGRLTKRFNELEKRQKDIMLHIEKLDEIVTKRVVFRELTDVKIRIRNLHKNCKTITDVNCLVPEKDAVKIVAEEDDDFDPELVELNTTRPEMRMYPKTPLPHSQPFWPRVVRVARGWADVPLCKQLGQFTGMEEDEKLMWQGEEWEFSYYKDEEEDYINNNNNNNTRDGGCFKGYKALDHPCNLYEVKDELVQSVEDTPAEDPAALIGHEEESAMNDKEKDLAHLKRLFTLDKIAAASANKSQSSSESSTDQSGDSDDTSGGEKDKDVFTKIKNRVDEEMINKVKAIVVQNTQDNSKSFLNQKKSLSLWSGTQARSATVVHSCTKYSR